MNECRAGVPDRIEALQQWAKLNKVPLNATFELTPLCNFSCVMCYVHLTREQMESQGKMLSGKQWLEIAKQAKELGTLNVCITGGEPFVHPDFWEIYSELNKMGFLISIMSNGALIDEGVIEKFTRYGMPYSIKLTVYGASDETYMRVCKSPDGFTRVSKAIDLIKQAGVPCKLTSTIVRENADDLQNIYNFARKKGLPLIHTISIVKSSRGAETTPAKSRFAFSDFQEELSLADLEKSKFPPLKSPFARCASYGNSFWMAWDGKMQACAFMNTPCADFTGSLKASWNELQEKISRIKNPAECEACEWQSFCQRCPGILCAESGSPEKVSNDLCLAAKRLYEIYKGKKVFGNEEEIRET